MALRNEKFAGNTKGTFETRRVLRCEDGHTTGFSTHRVGQVCGGNDGRCKYTLQIYEYKVPVS